jgi:hypothetical protein
VNIALNPQVPLKIQIFYNLRNLQERLPDRICETFRGIGACHLVLKKVNIRFWSSGYNSVVFYVVKSVKNQEGNQHTGNIK